MMDTLLINLVVIKFILRPLCVVFGPACIAGLEAPNMVIN